MLDIMLILLLASNIFLNLKAITMHSKNSLIIICNLKLTCSAFSVVFVEFIIV